MALTPFPFEPLPPGEVTTWTGPGERQELLQRDVKIIHWFIEERNGCQLRDSPLAELLDLSARADLDAPSTRIEDMPKGKARFLLHATGHFMRLAWAIRALYGRESVERIDGSFIRRELMGEDSKELGIEQKLPGGIGTLVWAGRLVQAGGGRTCINGNQVEGHDIRWRTSNDDVVLLERKDRSYEAGLADTTESRVLRVVSEVKKAKIPREEGAARILIVGFQHLVRPLFIRTTDGRYARALRKAFGERPPRELPHMVIADHFGIEPRTAGQKANFFSPQPLFREPAVMDRVAPLVLRALGQEGTKQRGHR